MAKSYKLLHDKILSEAKNNPKLLTQMPKEMPLYELRKARYLSQMEIAKVMNTNQASISKIERQTDMYISTLRKFIKAMGGDLEIVVCFPDSQVKINFFGESK